MNSVNSDHTTGSGKTTVEVQGGKSQKLGFVGGMGGHFHEENSVFLETPGDEPPR